MQPDSSSQDEVELASGSNAGLVVAEAGIQFVWTAVKAVVLTGLVGVTLWFSYAFGYTIYKSYFEVPEEVEVPAITGKEVADAYRLLESVGLQLHVHESRHEKKIPERVIVSQDPAAGRKVRKNRAILAVVSLGPELLEVPDLRGKTVRDAEIILSNSRLRLGEVEFKAAVDGEPERILHQNPGAGEKVRKGEAIKLQVQKGAGSAMIDVPRWTGRPLYRLDTSIAKANLLLDEVSWVYSDFVPRGEVLKQSPDQGQRVRSQAKVALEVSAGPTSKNCFKQRKLKIEIPSGNLAQEVAVLLNNEVGAATIFRGKHMGGNEMELLVAGFPGSEIEVYINDTLARRERL